MAEEGLHQPQAGERENRAVARGRWNDVAENTWGQEGKPMHKHLSQEGVTDPQRYPTAIPPWGPLFICTSGCSFTKGTHPISVETLQLRARKMKMKNRKTVPEIFFPSPGLLGNESFSYSLPCASSTVCLPMMDSLSWNRSWAAAGGGRGSVLQ